MPRIRRMATTRPAWRHLTFDPWHVALTLVFLAALSLRLYGLNWDQGSDLHPDELFVAKIVLIDRIHLDLLEYHITDNGNNARPPQPLNGRVVSRYVI